MATQTGLLSPFRPPVINLGVSGGTGYNAGRGAPPWSLCLLSGVKYSAHLEDRHHSGAPPLPPAPARYPVLATGPTSDPHLGAPPGAYLRVPGGMQGAAVCMNSQP